MNKIQQFAKALKERKKPGKRTARSDAPAPVPSCVKAAAGVSRLERLKAELRSANERADKAEAALAAVTKAEAVKGEVWRLNQQIARLREAAANRREKPQREQRQQSAVLHRGQFAKLRAAWRRIEELEEQLRKRQGETP